MSVRLRTESLKQILLAKNLRKKIEYSDGAHARVNGFDFDARFKGF